jgi:LysM repeat protein
LSFVVWANAGSPPPQQAVDEQTARAMLGLPTIVPTGTSLPTATATPVPVLPSLTPGLTPTPGATTYTVQAGESLESVATRLGVDTAVLWWTNRAQVDPVSPLVPGTQLLVPLVPGFLYQVQPGDSWDSVAATFGTSAAELRLRNERSEDASLPPGSLVFIPRST